MILSFIGQNCIHLKSEKKIFLFSAPRNTGFKILPQIENTTLDLRHNKENQSSWWQASSAVAVCKH